MRFTVSILYRGSSSSFPWPTRHGTDERGIPAYASISAPGSIGWHLRSGAPSMALLRPYNTLTLFLLFFLFSSLLLIHHRCSFLFFFFSFPNMEDNLSRGCPFYFLLPEHSRFALPFVYYGLIFYFIFCSDAVEGTKMFMLLIEIFS